jgi:predicted CXXCH cytochrome family protein
MMADLAEKLEKPETGERKGKGKKKYLWLLLSAFLFATMSYYMFAYPQRMIGPQQPIPFSHRVHAGVKAIPCQFCHPFAERSQNAGLPPVEKCFFCHKYIIPQHPQILKEWDHLVAKKPVAWIRIFFTPDYVFFNHRPHVGWNKIDCTRCHGDVKSQDRLQCFDFQMGFCVGCHRERKAQLDCWLACHR